MNQRRNFLVFLSSLGLAAFLPISVFSKKPKKSMIVHQVYFWLHQPDKDLKSVMEGCRKIGSISSAKDYLVGVPAKTEKRDVIDDSYHIALTVYFEDIKSHDVYQEHPDHLKFINEHSQKWAKVQVYDFEV
jgi:hypothetical protein